MNCAGGASQARGLLGYFGRAFEYSPTHLRVLALVLLLSGMAVYLRGQRSISRARAASLAAGEIAL